MCSLNYLVNHNINKGLIEMEIKRKEGSNITYADEKITVKGETFKLEGTLSTSQLMTLYSSGKGRIIVTLTVNMPDKIESVNKKIKINALIDELANKGLTEEQIMNTEVTV